MDNLNTPLQSIEGAIIAIGNEYSDMGRVQDSTLETLNNTLRVFFKDIKYLNIMGIYFTKNIDLPLFGIIVGPISTDPDEGINQIIDYGAAPIKTINIEIDSKLFDLGFDSKEILSILIYNIQHITNKNLGERLKDVIHSHLINTDSYIKYKESVQYQAILQFGVIDTLIKLSNALYLDKEVESDPFIVSLDLGLDFRYALDKLRSNTMLDELNSDNNFRFSVLYWCLNVYKDVKNYRIPAINQLKRSKELNPSLFYKRTIDRVIDALYKIDTDSLVNESVSSLKEHNILNNIINDKVEINAIINNRVLEMFDRASTMITSNLNKIDKAMNSGLGEHAIYEQEYLSYMELKDKFKNLLVREEE